MIKADVGVEIRNAIGSSIEIDATGPIPGRTPTSVLQKPPPNSKKGL